MASTQTQQPTLKAKKRAAGKLAVFAAALAVVSVAGLSVRPYLRSSQGAQLSILRLTVTPLPGDSMAQAAGKQWLLVQCAVSVSNPGVTTLRLEPARLAVSLQSEPAAEQAELSASELKQVAIVAAPANVWRSLQGQAVPPGHSLDGVASFLVRASLRSWDQRTYAFFSMPMQGMPTPMSFLPKMPVQQ